MKSAIKVVSLDKVRSPLLAIAVAELSSPSLPRSLQALGHGAKRELARLLASGDFTGERDQTSLVYPTQGPKRVLLIGLGGITEITRGAIRRAAAIAGRKAISPALLIIIGIPNNTSRSQSWVSTVAPD